MSNCTGRKAALLPPLYTHLWGRKLRKNRRVLGSSHRHLSYKRICALNPHICFFDSLKNVRSFAASVLGTTTRWTPPKRAAEPSPYFSFFSVVVNNAISFGVEPTSPQELERNVVIFAEFQSSPASLRISPAGLRLFCPV